MLGWCTFRRQVASVKETSCTICYSDAVADIANVVLFLVCKQAPETESGKQVHWNPSIVNPSIVENVVQII